MTQLITVVVKHFVSIVIYTHRITLLLLVLLFRLLVRLHCCCTYVVCVSTFCHPPFSISSQPLTAAKCTHKKWTTTPTTTPRKKIYIYIYDRANEQQQREQKKKSIPFELQFLHGLKWRANCKRVYEWVSKRATLAENHKSFLYEIDIDISPLESADNRFLNTTSLSPPALATSTHTRNIGFYFDKSNYSRFFMYTYT